MCRQTRREVVKQGARTKQDRVQCRVASFGNWGSENERRKVPSQLSVPGSVAIVAGVPAIADLVVVVIVVVVVVVNIGWCPSW